MRRATGTSGLVRYRVPLISRLGWGSAKRARTAALTVPPSVVGSAYWRESTRGAG